MKRNVCAFNHRKSYGWLMFTNLTTFCLIATSFALYTTLEDNGKDPKSLPFVLKEPYT
jgi:hypothetical protein